ncbi:MAG: hypothetical protein JRJ12_08690 [Deltaproteobacteria bacterium]|nr:hypothetical protein [Deltaproteobacteria bacterium]MBW2069615.1 hypothetical protein [Deltaproteobacteria bacterium]
MKRIHKKVSLIIPVESQWREFDAKMLLACIAAARGFSAYIGPNTEIESQISSFPKGFYLAYRLKSGNARFFRILCKLGFEIVAWDEEALVRLPSAMYYSRRLSPKAFRWVSHLFAWGKDNFHLWRRYPHLSSDTPIQITGNPRFDLLRSELRAFYEQEAAALQEKYGNYILLNTNFKHVNAFYPFLNILQPSQDEAAAPILGRGGSGMTLEYAVGLHEHKKKLFHAFQEAIPLLEQAFPDYTIIVRPHPVEDQRIYHNIAARCKRIIVTNDGNVVLWMLAAKALIHNGCTTAVEAHSMGLPAISYCPVLNELYDAGFYHLPNSLSHQCLNFEQLCQTLSRILAGELGPPDGAKIRELLDHYLAAQDGPLASHRIVDVLEKTVESRPNFSRAGIRDRLHGRYLAVNHRLKKKHRKTELRRHRYPGIALEELQKQVDKMLEVLKIDSNIRVKQLAEQIFQISS